MHSKHERIAATVGIILLLLLYMKFRVLKSIKPQRFCEGLKKIKKLWFFYEGNIACDISGIQAKAPSKRLPCMTGMCAKIRGLLSAFVSPKKPRDLLKQCLNFPKRLLKRENCAKLKMTERLCVNKERKPEMKSDMMKWLLLLLLFLLLLLPLL